jgi:hypothetical protein
VSRNQPQPIAAQLKNRSLYFVWLPTLTLHFTPVAIQGVIIIEVSSEIHVLDFYAVLDRAPYVVPAGR